jgi:hypothetical protein
MYYFLFWVVLFWVNVGAIPRDCPGWGRHGGLPVHYKINMGIFMGKKAVMKAILFGLLAMLLVSLSYAADKKLIFKDVAIAVMVEDEEVVYDISFTIQNTKSNMIIPIVEGDFGLLPAANQQNKYAIEYVDTEKRFQIKVLKGGELNCQLKLIGKPFINKETFSRSCKLDILLPAHKSFSIGHKGLEKKFIILNAIDVSKEKVDDIFYTKGFLSDLSPLVYSWESTENTGEGRLVASAQIASSIIVNANTLNLTHVFKYSVMQGKFQELQIEVPAHLHITQVEGQFIQDWKISADAKRMLTIQLNRPQNKEYYLRIISELPIESLPSDVTVPNLVVQGDFRTYGNVVVSTNSALQMVMKKTTGLTQVDQMDKSKTTSNLSKSFYYIHPSGNYDLVLSIKEIKSSFDVKEQIVVATKEENLQLFVNFQLEVRDAPLKKITIVYPEVFNISEIKGSLINQRDYIISTPTDLKGFKRIEIPLLKPIMGTFAFDLELETGKDPLQGLHKMSGLSVENANSERGTIVFVSSEGVFIDKPIVTELREIPTGSLTSKISDAKFAYRFRKNNWNFDLKVFSKETGIYTEGLHLLSLADQVMYGSTTFSYRVTGAPIDHLSFRIAEGLQNIEFIGKDVVNWEKEGKENFKVKLRKKILGDYNIGISYTQKLGDDEGIILGGVICAGVDTQTGFVVLASQQNMMVKKIEATGMIEIPIDEIPKSYHLLIHSPVIKSLKYINENHKGKAFVESFRKSELVSSLIEMMDIETKVFLREEGQAEAVSKIRYHVKNTNEQYLTLQLPQNSVIWSTKYLNSNDDQNGLRVTSAIEGKLVKIPLQRKQNPNEPLLIELQYGQSLGKMNKVFTLALDAPKTSFEVTYCSWNLQVPEGWFVKAKSGPNTMSVDGYVKSESLYPFMVSFFENWYEAFAKVVFSGGILPVIFVLMGLGILYKVILKVKYKAVIIMIVLAVFIFIGVVMICAGIEISSNPVTSKFNQLNYTRVLSLSQGEGLSIAANISTTYINIMNSTTLILIVVCLVLGVVLAFKYSFGRYFFTATLLTSLVYLGVHSAMMQEIFIHLFSWGIFTGLFIYLMIVHIKKRIALSKEVATAILLFLILPLLPSIAKADQEEKPTPKPTIYQQSNKSLYSISVEKDHLKIDLNYKISANKEQREFIDNASIFIEENIKLPKGVELEKKESGYFLKFLKKGDYAIDLTYLIPISKESLMAKDLNVRPVTSMFCDVILKLPSKELDVFSKDSFNVKKEIKENEIIYTASFLPGAHIRILWQPKSRDTKSEETVFYTDTLGLWKFSKGVIEGEYLVQLKIAQGELQKTTLHLPKGVDVSSVSGEFIGSWAFEKDKRQLEIKFMKPITGHYYIRITFQTPQETTPYDWKSFAINIQDSTRSTLEVGIANSYDVYLGVQSGQALMESADFKIDFLKMAKQVPQASNLEGLELKSAYRFLKVQENVSVVVNEVEPEIRLQEAVSFSVEEDRQVYNAKLQVDIAKAGVFYITIEIPKNYDVDGLAGEAVSHWDEIEVAGHRTLQIHFVRRMIGKVNLNLTMSRNVLMGAEDIIVPKILLPLSKKHDGFLIVSSGRGIQLRVKESISASEKDPVAYNIFDKRATAFKILSEQWQVVLKPEIMQLRVNLDFLHEIKISEGVVHHTHYLRYQPFNAGVKDFIVQLPKNIFGLRIMGAQIANKKESTETPGLWTISLEEKWFDREYALTVFYETSFESNEYKLSSFIAKDVDLVKGFIVVYSKDRIELMEKSKDNEVQISDARNMPIKFGAGDLSLSSFSYTTNKQNYELSYVIKRHLVAKLLAADCLSANFCSVVNMEGDIVTRSQLDLMVGSKRNLEVELPQNAKVWTIVVNGRFENPYIRKGETKNRFLITLPNTSFEEKKVEIEFIYVQKKFEKLYTKCDFEGPQFDLPLKNIRWEIYVPQNWNIGEIDGTLLPVKNDNIYSVSRYSINDYEDDVSGLMSSSFKKSKDFQKQAEEFNKSGQRKNAVSAYQNAYNWSHFDVALNEDARVQLHALNQEQAVVGLINRRNDIAKNLNGKSGGVEPLHDLDNIRPEDVSMLQNSIAKDDNDNIGLICSNIVKTQETVNMQNVQLFVNMPINGKKIEVKRSLQVKPFDQMEVTFNKSQIENESPLLDSLILLAMIVGGTLAFWILRRGK